MAKIISHNGRLAVPDFPEIPYIAGDGVGAEITPAMQAIVDAALALCYGGKRRIYWMEVLAGEKAVAEKGTPLPDDTLDVFREYLVGIKGPLNTPVGGGMRSLNVALRQDLDLYVCLRPVRWYKGVASPVKEPQKVDMHIFRENTEDIYAGIEWKAGTPEAGKFYKFISEEMGVKKVRFPESSSFGVKPVSQEGSQRLVKAAIEYALTNHLPKVTLVHKGNIMKFTEGGFRDWGYDVAETQFADVAVTTRQLNAIKAAQGPEAAEKARAAAKLVVDDCIADAFLQNTLLTPERYSGIATLNLNGDYVSDQLAAMVGGIGIAPGANINYATGHAIFEATHGTAPDIAGQNKVNPCSILLSAVMMLRYMGWTEPADTIENALERAFATGHATADLARFMDGATPLGTKEFTEYIVKNL
jgi:isocitrate dehydrogenase